MSKKKTENESKLQIIPLGGLEQTVIGAKTYLLVTDEEDGDSEALILRDDSDMNDEEAVYVIVDDDQELEAVAGVFRKLLSEDGVDLDI